MQGDNSKLTGYLDTLIADIPDQQGTAYCDNSAVNAIVSHYAALAKQSGIPLSVKLTVPKHTQQISITVVAEKHGGAARFESDGCVFQASAYVCVKSWMLASKFEPISPGRQAVFLSLSPAYGWANNAKERPPIFSNGRTLFSFAFPEGPCSLISAAHKKITGVCHHFCGTLLSFVDRARKEHKSNYILPLFEQPVYY